MRRQLMRSQTLPKRSWFLDGCFCVLVSAIALLSAPSVSSRPVETRHALTMATGSLYSVSCGSQTSCVAVGGGILASKDGGSIWHTQELPSSITNSGTSQELTSIACPTALSCITVGFDGAILVTDTAGAAWRVVQAADDNDYLDGVACPSATHCIAVGYGRQAILLVTADGGTKWVVSRAPQDVHQLTAVSCATATECLAVGSNRSGGVVIRTKNGGLSWTTVPFPLGAAGQVVALSCFTAYGCALVVQNRIIVTTNAGRTWESYALPSHLYPAGIACMSASSCVLVGGHEIASTQTGLNNWKLTELVSPSVSGLYGTFCSSAEDCVAVGAGNGAGSVLVSTDGGASWHSARVP
jgi:photosystem II stability/assembly factor-like uncharacterized protein